MIKSIVAMGSMGVVLVLAIVSSLLGLFFAYRYFKIEKRADKLMQRIAKLHLENVYLRGKIESLLIKHEIVGSFDHVIPQNNDD